MALFDQRKNRRWAAYVHTRQYRLLIDPLRKMRAMVGLLCCAASPGQRRTQTEILSTRYQVLNSAVAATLNSWWWRWVVLYWYSYARYTAQGIIRHICQYSAVDPVPCTAVRCRYHVHGTRRLWLARNVCGVALILLRCCAANCAASPGQQRCVLAGQVLMILNTIHAAVAT